MSENGLSNNRLEELRRQREEERKRKLEAEKQKEAELSNQPASEPAQEVKEEVPNSEEISVKTDETDLHANRQFTTSNVNIIGEDEVLVQNSAGEEDGKVQVGYTMVDDSLVKEAKYNKRYGIKERSELYRRLNTIVFYVAIPFMIVWIILAFAGVCTIKVGYTSFANNIYYTVNDTTAINGYNKGEVLVVKAAGAEDAKIGSVVCVEFVNINNNKKSLHLLRVTEKLGSNGNYTLRVKLDNDNDGVLINQYGYSSTEDKFLYANNNDIRYLGVLDGKDFILGKFIIFSQNIVAFIFIVIVPVAIILTFQIINLYDGIRIYRIQKKIAKSSNKKETKQTDDIAKDKVVR